MKKIGVLKEVNLRDLWKHEQYDFSSWLAEEENIRILSEELGFSLSDIKTEVFVGSYRCDLVAKDEITGETIIIENQLEDSNHDHLGKIITYAAGLGSKTIIWIVKKAREEHIAAIEWLNSNTSKEVSFFLVELHAYQINDSIPAPMFKIIEKPNDFVKNSKSLLNGGELTKIQSERFSFWEKMNESIIEKGRPFNISRPTTASWYNVSIGSREAHVSVSVIGSRGHVVVELYINNNKELYDELFEHKSEVESKIKFELEWCRLQGKKACRISSYIQGLDFENHDNYPILIDETIKRVIELSNVFKPLLKK